MNAPADRAWLLFGDGVRSLSHEGFLRALRSEGRQITGPADAYERVVWVYRCVQLRTQLVGALSYIVRAGDTEIPFESLPFLLRQIEFALCLWGAAFVLKTRAGLQWLNPSTMRVVATSSGIAGFEQQSGGRSHRYRPQDIVYVRLPNPHDDLGPGIAPARVCLDAATLAWAANAYAQAFFTNGAIPAVLLTTENPMPPEEISRVRAAWERLFGGARQAHKTAVLAGGLKPTVIGSPAKDVVLADVLREARQQIAVAFGIPQTLLEDAANFATAREHVLSLYRETIIPEAELIRDELNEQFFSERGMEVEFVYGAIEALQQDEASKAAQLALLVERGIMSTDEAREQLGLESRAPAETPPGPEAERGLPQDALAELGRWRRKAKRGRYEFETRLLPDWVVRAARWRLENLPGDDPLASWVRAYDRGGAEDELQRALAATLRDLGEEIIEDIQAGRDPTPRLETMRERLGQALVPALTLIVVDALTAEAAAAGVEVPLEEMLSDAAQWAQQYTYDLVRGIQDTQVQHVQHVIAQLANGQIDADGARAMLEPLFGPVRAQMIAATEVTRATSQAVVMYQQALRERGFTTVRRWLTAEDERVCPICGALDHKTEDVWAQEFPDGPPAHVNCRCQVVLEWQRRR